MAAATYTTDLTTVTDAESGTFTEPTSATLGTLTSADTDNFIQGSKCTSKTTGASGAPARAGIGFLAGAGQSISTPQCVYTWVFTGAGALVDTYANGGIRIIVGSSSANYKEWYVLGNDTFPYVGWTCVAVDPSLTADATTGSPSATLQYFGADFNCLINIGKGNPMAIDKIAWGRVVTILNGDSGNGYATFAGCATQNDTNTNRWGQFQAIPGGYQLQGKLLLGTTGSTAVDFRDSNVNFVTSICLKVAASFNAIEVQNTSSNISWDSISWSALGTVSRGTFLVTDNATVALTGCSFTNLSTFGFLSSTTCSSIFRLCDTVTGAGANLSSSQFLVPRVAADTSAVVWNVNTDTDGKFDNCKFSKGTNAHHAIELGTSSPTTVTFRGITFTGFNSANANNDSVIHVKRTTGSVTLNAVGCSGTVSYKTAGATVTVVQDPVTTTVTVVDATTLSVISGARVLVTASDNTGPMPFDETVTISRSGSVATVSHTTHGLVDNTKVKIKGATQTEYNGVFTLTYIDANSYSYTVSGTPATPATGTIKATGVVIDGTTNGSGIISDTRTHASAQPIIGRVRKATSGTLYKTGAISGSISNSTGFSVTVQLIPDQ